MLACSDCIDNSKHAHQSNIAQSKGELFMKLSILQKQNEDKNVAGYDTDAAEETLDRGFRSIIRRIINKFPH